MEINQFLCILTWWLSLISCRYRCRHAVVGPYECQANNKKKRLFRITILFVENIHRFCQWLISARESNWLFLVESSLSIIFFSIYKTLKLYLKNLTLVNNLISLGHGTWYIESTCKWRYVHRIIRWPDIFFNVWHAWQFLLHMICPKQVVNNMSMGCFSFFSVDMSLLL